MEHFKKPALIEELLKKQEEEKKTTIEKENSHKMSEYEQLVLQMQKLQEDFEQYKNEQIREKVREEEFYKQIESENTPASTEIIEQVIDDDSLNVKSIKLSNLLARGAFRTTSIWTERIFALICKDVTSTGQIKDQYIFTKRNLSGSNIGGHNDELLKSISNTLTKETIEFSFEVINNAKTKEQKAEAKKAKDDTIKAGGSFNIFSYSLWEDCDNRIAVALNHDFRPYLLSKAADYTSFNDEEFLSLGSVFGQRLFRLIMSNARLEKNKNGFEITTKELYFVLNPPEKFQKNFAIFEREVLSEAVKDITRHTNLRFSYEKQKTGVKVTSIFIRVANNLTIPSKNTIKLLEAKDKNR